MPVAIHRSSDPGHWIVAYPWTLSEQAETIAETFYVPEWDTPPAPFQSVTAMLEGVVTIGYGEQQADRLAGSVAAVR